MARDFNGSTDEILYNHLDALDGATKVTVSVHIKPGTGGESFGGIMKQMATNSDTAGIAILNDGTDETNLFIAFRDGASNEVRTGPGSITAGVFNHLHVVYDGTQGVSDDRMKVWIDGSSVAITHDGTHPTSLPTHSVGMFLGRIGSGLNWEGAIAEFAIWATDITDIEQIRALSDGVSPLLVHPNPDCYLPLVRDTFDRMGELGSGSLTGTSVVDHRDVIYPAPPQIITAPAVAAPGGIVVLRRRMEAA